MALDKEQIDLLCLLVETARNIPSDKRRKFIAVESSTHTTLRNWSLPNWYPDVYKSDIEILDRNGFLNLSTNSQGDYIFDLLPEAFQYYENVKQKSVEPLSNIESEVHRYISDPVFRQRFPTAFDLWNRAEIKLWSADSNNELTSIGLSCREAMQEFIDALIINQRISNADPDKAHTLNRLRLVLSKFSGNLGSTVSPFLEALVAYFETLDDLVQRQVHGSTKEGEKLRWDDARRIVFHCAVVMSEIDASISAIYKDVTA